ncbi:MAG: S-layer homology domain-containing protein, partial [Oscillospiraceae bacterium]
TEFAPNADITREQMATMMVRAIKLFDTPVVSNDLRVFSDFNQISSWAVESLSYLNQMGIIKGMSDAEIAPLENTTREQAILIVYRTFKTFESDEKIEN